MKTSNQCKAANFILVRINNNNKQKSDNICSSEIKQLSRAYNISYIEASLNSEKSIHDLFTFAIKYYWFCMVKGDHYLKL